MSQDIKPAQVRLIRFALLGGILLFGTVAAFVASQDPAGLGLSREGPVAGVTVLLVLLGAGAVMFVRRKLEMTGPLPERLRLLIVGHAVCEASALMGAVHLLLTGGVIPYVAGLTVFCFSLVLLPIERN